MKVENDGLTRRRGGRGENCTAIGVPCATLLSAASAPPREAFLPALLADEAPLRAVSRQPSLHPSLAPSADSGIAGSFKGGATGRRVRRRPRVRSVYRLRPTRATVW